MRSSPLTFEPIDRETFPLFEIGTEAGRRGGSSPIAFNAANEVAVAAFLAGEISFPVIGEVVGETVDRMGTGAVRGLEDVLEADRDSRELARSLMPTEGAIVRGYNG